MGVAEKTQLRSGAVNVIEKSFGTQLNAVSVTVGHEYAHTSKLNQSVVGNGRSIVAIAADRQYGQMHIMLGDESCVFYLITQMDYMIGLKVFYGFEHVFGVIVGIGEYGELQNAHHPFLFEYNVLEEWF